MKSKQKASLLPTEKAAESKEEVNKLTEKLRMDGYQVISGQELQAMVFISAELSYSVPVVWG